MSLKRILFCLALASCSDPNLAGTYTGSLTGSYRLVGDEKRVDFSLPSDTVVVKIVSRQYQYYQYEVLVRGCKLTVEGDFKTASIKMNSRCEVDMPKLGPVVVTTTGGITGKKKGELTLSMGMGGPSEGSKVASFDMTFSGKSP